MKYRTQIADVLKGIAVLLMIQVHIVELFATDSIYNSSSGEILLFLGGPPVAPVFMLVFGYFIFSTSKTTLQLVLRGIGVFILGMLLNIALNFNLIISVYQKKLQVDIWPYVFGVDILQFAGLGLIIIAVFKPIIEKQLILLLTFILFFAFSGTLLTHIVPQNTALKYLSAFIYGSTDWSYFPLFPWLAYPLSGIAFCQLQQRYDFSLLDVPKIKLLNSALFLVFIGLTLKYAIAISSNLSSYYHHGILFFGWVIVFGLFYTLSVHQLQLWFGNTLVIKYLKWLGQYVTIIYVIQWIIIGNIATEIYKTVTSTFYLTCWYLATVIVSSGLAYILLKLKKKSIKP